MRKTADKDQKNQNSAVAHEPSQTTSGAEETSEFVDNRSEAVQLRTAQLAADISPRSDRIKRINAISEAAAVKSKSTIAQLSAQLRQKHAPSAETVASHASLAESTPRTSNLTRLQLKMNASTLIQPKFTYKNKSYNKNNVADLPTPPHGLKKADLVELATSDTDYGELKNVQALKTAVSAMKQAAPAAPPPAGAPVQPVTFDSKERDKGMLTGAKYIGTEWKLAGKSGGKRKLEEQDFTNIVNGITMNWLSSIRESSDVIRHDWQNYQQKNATSRNFQIQWGGSKVVIGKGKGDSTISTVLVAEELFALPGVNTATLLTDVKQAHRDSRKNSSIIEIAKE